MLQPVRTIAPSAADPLVPTGDAVRHCRVDPTDGDTATTIASLVQAATSYIENKLEYALVSQTWRQDFCSFDDDTLRLMRVPVVSITSVTYYDANNASQTLASSVYTVLTDSLGPYLALKADQEWPTIYDRSDALSITYVAGFGTASQVPDDIKHAAKMLVSHWNENREAAGPKEMAAVPLAVDALLMPYQRIYV